MSGLLLLSEISDGTGLEKGRLMAAQVSPPHGQGGQVRYGVRSDYGMESTRHPTGRQLETPYNCDGGGGRSYVREIKAD